MTKKLEVKDADVLFYEPHLVGKQFIQGLLPQGLAIISGDAKIGKSWLMLWIALQLAEGKPIWDRETIQCETLYLCLEDPYYRIQQRLFELIETPPEGVHFVRSCNKIGSGLETEIENTLIDYPKVGLLIIDTLQRIRNEPKPNVNAYASDYKELTVLKDIADRYNICILLVHHNRKTNDSKDPMNDILGSSGIVGTVDTMLAFKKDERFTQTATLYATGRDVEPQELKLNFDGKLWTLLACKGQTDLAKEQIPEFLFQIVTFMSDKAEWKGTVTELLAAVGNEELKPNKASMFIAKFYADALLPAGIRYAMKRTGSGRLLTLMRSDDSVDCDGEIHDKKPSS